MTDFAIKLQQWYRINKRPLPWRQTKDPYKVWLSEIIMQQTQVIQGESYYLKFIDNFPTVDDLASASEQKVLKLWEGLGYYSRARNLHASAKMIVSNYNSQFPTSYKNILTLKGVGPYTAAAISSFCFELPHAVVDGNVFRFLSRLKGIVTPIDSTIGKKEFDIMAQTLLDKNNAGEHNQAMMEFGALVCKPATPSCPECPFNTECYAFLNSRTKELPVKTKKIKQQKRYFHYFLVQNNNAIYIEKRSGKGIWENLYQLPLLETTRKLLSQSFLKKMKYPPALVNEKKHILSHQVIYASFYVANESVITELDGKYLKVDIDELSKYPFPQLLANFLTDSNLVRQD